MGLCSFTRVLFHLALLGAARLLSRVSGHRFLLRHAVHRHGDAVAETAVQHQTAEDREKEQMKTLKVDGSKQEEAQSSI